MTLRCLWILLPALLLATSSALAESEGKEEKEPKKVFVPVEDWEEVVKAEPDGILLTYEQYKKLRDLAMQNKRKREGEKSPARAQTVLQSANYVARLDGKILRVDAVFLIQNRIPGYALLPLRLDRVGVTKAELDGKDAGVYRTPKGRLELLLEGEGLHRLHLSFVTPVKDRPTGKEVHFSIPPAPAAHFKAVLPGELEVETKPAFTESRRKEDDDTTEVQSALGGASSFLLKFRAKAIEAELIPVIEVDTSLDLAVDGVAKAQWTFVYNVHRTPVSGLTWALPEGWTISAPITSPHPLSWEEADGLLRVHFRSPQKGSFRVKVEMEREAKPGLMRLPLLTPRGVHLARGSAQVYVDKRFSPRLKTLDGARVIDVKPKKGKTLFPFRAFQYLKPDPNIEVDLRVVEARTRAFVRNLLRIQEREVRLTSRTLVSVREGDLFAMNFGLPEGYSADEVRLSGANGEWKISNDGRQLHLAFPKPLPAGKGFHLFLALRSPIRTGTESPTALPLPVVTTGAMQEEGVVAVSAPDSLRIQEQEDSFSGLTRLDPGTQMGLFRIFDPQMRLAYRYRHQPYAGALAVLREKPQVNLTTTIFYALRGSALHAVAHLQYLIRKAPVDRVAFQVPLSVEEGVMIQGAGAKPASRSQTETVNLWTVPLQSKVIGTFNLHVSFPISLEGLGDESLLLPWIRGHGVSSENGQVAVEASEEARISVEAQQLESIPTEEIEAPPGLKDAKALFAYKYAKPNWALALKITRHQSGEVAKVIIENLSGTVQVDPDGGEKTSATFLMKEAGLQDFRMMMPDNYELWSLTVDGVGVKPARSGNLLIVPLEPRGPTQRLVKVVYRRPGNGLTTLGKFHTTFPRFDVGTQHAPVLSSSMTVVVPGEYQLIGAGGSMTPLFAHPRPRSLLRRVYEKFRGLAVVLAFAVLAAIALIYYREKVTYALQEWVIPNKVAVNAIVGGTALLVLLIVLSTSFMSVMSDRFSGGDKSAPQSLGVRSRAASAPDRGIAEESIEGEEAQIADYNETDDNKDYKRPARTGRFSERHKGKKRAPRSAGIRPGDTRKTADEEEIEERLERDVYENKKKREAEPPIEDPVLKDAEKSDHLQKDKKELQRQLALTKARDRERRAQAQQPAPQKAPPAATPTALPDPQARPPAPDLPAESPKEQAEAEAGKSGAGEEWGDEDKVADQPFQGKYWNNAIGGGRGGKFGGGFGGLVQTRGIRTLDVNLADRGRHFPFRGEGGVNRVNLYLLGRACRNGIGFLFFLVGLILPIVMIREWKPYAVAVVPACSGICNLGVMGLVCGVLLLGLLPGVRWVRNVAARWAFPVLLLAAVILAAPSAFAGEKKPEKKGEPSKVYIPYDPEKVKGGIPMDKVFLPYKEFLRLWDLAFPGQATRPKPPKAPFAHRKAQYVAEISEGWLRGGAIFFVEAHGEDPVEIPLGLKGAMVEGVKADGKPAALRERKDGYAFVATQAKAYKLEVTFRAKAKGEGKSGRVSLGLFPIPQATALIRLTDPVLTCEVPTSLGGLTRQKSPGAEILTAFLGPAKRLVVEYRPKEAERESEFATLKARSTTHLVAEPGRQKVHHTCAFEVVGSPRDRFRFALAEELKVLQVKGPNIRAWGFREQDGRRILEIHLQKPEEKKAAYTIEGLRSLEGGAVAGELPLLRPMDCMQEKGSVIVECPPHIRLTVEERGILEPVDKRNVRKWKYPVSAAFQFSRRPLKLAYRLQLKPIRVEGHLHLAMMVTEEDVRLGAFVLVNSNGAPAFHLETTLPAGFRLDRVHGVFGPGIKDWWDVGEGDARRLNVILTRGLKDQMGFVVWMSQKISLKGEPKSIPIPSLVLQEAEAYRGRIVVLAFPGVRLESQDLVGLEPAAARGVWQGFCGALRRPCPPTGIGAIAFSFDGTEYSGKIFAQAQDPVLSCNWTLHQRLRKDMVEYGLYLTFRAEKAPAKSLAFSLPEEIPPEWVVIPHFAGKREEERIPLPNGRVLYRVGLQQGFLGTWRLAAHILLPLEAGEGPLDIPLPMVAPEGVGAGEVKGFVVVENAESGAELRETGMMTGLEKIGAAELKRAGALPPQVGETDVTFAFRAEKVWGGTIRLETLEVEKPVDVAVGYIEILTVIQEEGDSWNHIQFNVTNRARQFLEIVMPGESRLLSLFVDGRAAKPGKARDGSVLVPLPKRSLAQPSFPVAITFSLKYPPLITAKNLDLQHPILRDPKIKVGKIMWSVRVPERFSFGFTGDMEETEKGWIVEEKRRSEIRETEQAIANLEKLPAAQQAEAVVQIVDNLSRNRENLKRNKALGQISSKSENQLRSRLKQQEDFIQPKAAGFIRELEQQRLREEARDIRRNTAVFNMGQRGLRADVWQVLEPERARWDFREELRGKMPSPIPVQRAFQPQTTVPPRSLRGGASLSAVLPQEGFREFHFMKEGKKADLNARPWRDGALDWVGTLVKFAGLAMIFLAALLLGWLREAKGWPYRRVWIWLVLLIACGASLSSWEFALLAGVIAFFLAWREITWIREEKARRKPGYVV
jgi:hypothetical protein